jgi:hypothetical protein
VRLHGVEEQFLTQSPKAKAPAGLSSGKEKGSVEEAGCTWECSGRRSMTYTQGKREDLKTRKQQLPGCCVRNTNSPGLVATAKQTSVGKTLLCVTTAAADPETQ